jgi:hypothetical protein
LQDYIFAWWNIWIFVILLLPYVLAFISNPGPNNKPKMLKVGLKFLWPWLLV